MMLRHISAAVRASGGVDTLAWKLQLQSKLPTSMQRSIHMTHNTNHHHHHLHRRRTRQQQLGSFSTTTTNSHNNSNHDNNKASGVGDSNSSSSSLSSLSLEPSPVLTAAWPLLQERFDSLKNADGIFPLLTRTQEARFADVDAKAAAAADIDDDAKKKKYDEPADRRPDREAAVLMIVCSVNGQPGLLYTKRADHMALHGGEISFPGGHFDNSSNSDSTPSDDDDGDTISSLLLPDQTLLDTALREAHEELLPPLLSPDQTHQQQQQQQHQQQHQRRPSGNASSSLLQPPHLTVLGQTSRIPSLNGTPVTPFLAVLWPDLTVPVTAAAAAAVAAASDKDDDAASTTTRNDGDDDDDDGIISVRLEDYFPGDPQEVAAVFFVSLADLVRVERTHVLPKNRFGVTVAPYFPVQGHGHLWGLTAYITQPVLHRLLRPVFLNMPAAAAAAAAAQ
jgi:hypothetical protein